MQNSSGFTGYSIASVYPDLGNRMSDTMTTIVDPDEQERMSAIEPEKTISPAVNPQQKNQIWWMLLVVAGFILLFAKA